MLIDYTDALASGWRVFPLHEMNPDRTCACGHQDCNAAGKHPKNAAWQHTPEWDASQLDYLEDHDGMFFGNQLQDGYGIVVNTSSLLVVDVDGRNGGWPSSKELAHIRSECGYIVQTGSQNGEHWYFTAPAGANLRSQHPQYPGIDFKSTGFVVGAGSLHASGNRYHALEGSPDKITPAPQSLLDLLQRPAPSFLSSGNTEASPEELTALVAAIPNPGRDYEKWLGVGMALHNATGGSDAGYGLWLEWSSKGAAHDDALMPMKWHSFGKVASQITAGTLFKLAQEAGYTSPVEFADDTEWADVVPAVKNVPCAHHAPSAAATSAAGPSINLLRPPGFVGEVVDWINSRCAYPRERLAVAAGLQIVSNAAGLTHLVAGRNTSLNLITLAIAGSRTGKGAVKKCIDEAHRALGIQAATHGKFKSSQELIRNAIQHQGVYYIYDEFGKQLEKISGAGKSGAHYLEDLLAEMIAMYSEATGVHGLSGDLKREAVENADRAISIACKKMGLADGENPRTVAERDPDGPLAQAYKQRESAELGIVEPYLSFFGMSEPGSFNAALEKDAWLLSGGFLGRALIFEEEETVPLEKDPSKVSSAPLPMHLAGRLSAMLNNGSASTGARGERVERTGEWEYIQWAPEAEKFIRQVRQYWHDAAIQERDSGSGLESQALGATELAIKVAGILGAATGTIEREHIEWAHALVQDVTKDKMDRARSSEKLMSRAPKEKGSGLIESILRSINKLGAEQFTTAGRLRQAVGRSKVETADVTKALEHLCSAGRIRCEEYKTPQNKKVLRYIKIN